MVLLRFTPIAAVAAGGRPGAEPKSPDRVTRVGSGWLRPGTNGAGGSVGSGCVGREGRIRVMRDQLASILS